MKLNVCHSVFIFATFGLIIGSINVSPLVLFSNGLVSFTLLFFSLKLPVRVTLTVPETPTVSAADRQTYKEKGGNNEWTDAFILMKGINAKAFILSIIPLKSPLHSRPPPLVPPGPSY